MTDAQFFELSIKRILRDFFMSGTWVCFPGIHFRVKLLESGLVQLECSIMSNGPHITAQVRQIFDPIYKQEINGVHSIDFLF